ncbi:FLYWCH-type domain-containing protein [Aphis craccivora]|uniref:FLYWCH-type domain-containing protein n=1 Tax=Aphis craccivora TaxID=307492 RepID=A0A6G0VUY7_APHCR|nr:FLYWCH-type domain-containing protein [Aphis craccivora]
MAVAPDTAVSFIFSDYILENYIDSNCNFPPILWAFEPNGNPKTTNNAESFHKHYNSQFYTPHPHIHQVIDILMQIQSETDLKINSIKNNVINYKRKETVHKEEYLQDMWNKYKNKTIDRLTFIKNNGNKLHHTNLI